MILFEEEAPDVEAHIMSFFLKNASSRRLWNMRTVIPLQYMALAGINLLHSYSEEGEIIRNIFHRKLHENYKQPRERLSMSISRLIVEVFASSHGIYSGLSDATKVTLAQPSHFSHIFASFQGCLHYHSHSLSGITGSMT